MKCFIKKTECYVLVGLWQYYSAMRKKAQGEFKIRDDSRRVNMDIGLDFKWTLFRLISNYDSAWDLSASNVRKQCSDG